MIGRVRHGQVHPVRVAAHVLVPREVARAHAALVAVLAALVLRGGDAHDPDGRRRGRRAGGRGVHFLRSGRWAVSFYVAGLGAPADARARGCEFFAYLSVVSRRDARAVAASFVQCGGYVATYYRPLRSVYWRSSRVCSIIHGSRGTRPD